MTFDIIQIVPRLPPNVDGLGDYALSIAIQLRNHFNINSHFVVGEAGQRKEKEIQEFHIHYLENHSVNALLSALTRTNSIYIILLHYVGYGYARKGMPIWLIEGLEKWHKRNRAVCVLTMFHEIYAKGPIWTSSFWLAPIQKHLASRLTRLSDVCFTNREDNAVILHSLDNKKHGPIITLPVFSNVGEPKQTPLLLKDRKRRIVVFGGRANRLRVYEKSIADLKRVCQVLAIEEILDIGPPIDSTLPKIDNTILKQMGKLSSIEISSILSDSIAGFFDYSTAFLAKSGIFAAYTAHGVLPISASCKAVGADNLKAGIHYWVAHPHNKVLSLADGQEIANNAYAWYQRHRLSEHVKSFAATMLKSGSFSQRL